jgi:NifU-like protein involved in Fe-S cluster formation
MDYSSEVRQRFSDRARAGEISGEAGDWIEGAADDRSLAVWVRFQVEVRAGEIGRVRFRAFGCPHTLAAADRVAALLEGRPLEALTTIDWPELARQIDLPREKFGKLLRIEDALAACYAQAKRKQVS